MFLNKPIKINFLTIFLFSFYSGLIINITTPPISLYFLEFIMIIPFFMIIYHPEGRYKPVYSFIYGYLFNIFLLIGNFSWIINTVHDFGELNYLTSYIIFFIYILYHALKWGLIFFLTHFLYNRYSYFSIISILLLVCFTLESIFPEVFPYFISNPQLPNYYFIQIADIIGAKGLSLLIILINFLLYQLIKYRNRGYTLLLLGLIFILYSYSGLRTIEWYSYYNHYKPISFNVAAIQPNTPLSVNNYNQYLNHLYSRIKKVSGKKPIDLFILPESSIPIPLNSPLSSIKKLKDYIDNSPFPILYNNTLVKNNKTYSAAILHTSENKNQYYFKRLLMPFGEYLPLSSIFPSLKNVIPAISNFTAGKKGTIFNLAHQNKNISIIPVICYEILYPKLIRKNLNTDSNIIVNITNDKWFGNSKASVLHLYSAAMRAVENRVPLIRITNSGISTVINERGVFTYPPTKILSEQTIYTKVYLLNHIDSIYKYFGDWTLTIFFIVIFSYQFYRSKHEPVR